MVGRKFSAVSGGYRYGFNTHEKSDEIAGEGNHTTAEFGEYDTRLGRRWNLDPKPNTSISVYSLFENNPVWFNDIKLDTPIIADNASGAGMDYKAWKKAGMFNPPSESIFKQANDRFSIRSFKLQKLSGSSGDDINLDLYRVLIQKLPTGMTAGDLFTIVRKNFHAFMNTDITTLEAYDPGENDIWESSNPLTAVMRFKGYAAGVNVDDADVITSQYYYSSNSAFWTFTPVRDNSLFRSDSGHPLAGNREFGITPIGGTSFFTFYTQGIDRLWGSTDLLAKKTSYDFFADANKLWATVMGNIVTYINQQGGTASFYEMNVKSKRINYEDNISKEDREGIKKSGF